MSLLNNKIAVVTGGSSGIGLATAKRFVEEGAHVFIVGRRQAELDEAVAEIGESVTGVKTDISKLDDLDHLYETVAKKGKIDVDFCGRGLRGKSDDRRRDARAFRQDLQHQRPRHLFHRSKGAALLE
jgi:NAD(P)-dependent dehydrogenase (short-subunit alcohol dehydrogenase family)